MGTVAKSPSATLIHEWVEDDTFTWVVTEEILSEYKAVIARLGVRRPLPVPPYSPATKSTFRLGHSVADFNGLHQLAAWMTRTEQ